MGFFDRFRPSKTTLTAAAEPLVLAPGDQITVRYEVGGELDDNCRGVRIGLQGTGSYMVEETTQVWSGGGTNPDGSYSPGESHYQTQQVWRSHDLHLEEHEQPAQLGPGEAIFTVPEWAPPSSAGAVSWQAFARVDREKGKDIVRRVDLAVRVDADRLPGARAPQQMEDGLTLDDVPVGVKAGDTLSGNLTVNLPKDVSVTAARVRLHRRVTYTAAPTSTTGFYGGNPLTSLPFVDDNINQDLRQAELDLSGEREFKAGEIERIPFTIEVPANAEPSTEHSYAHVEWRVEALLDRRMRGDLAVETPLIVY